MDVVVVPIPFTDRLAARRRPVLIVSSTQFNHTHDEAILAMITSAISNWVSDFVLRDWHEAGLNVPCKVRFKLFTLGNELTIRKLGNLSGRDIEAGRSRLSRTLALA